MAWTLERLFRRIDGRRIRIGRRTMRVDTATLACGGMLRDERRGTPTFARVRCVQPMFASDGSPGPDLIFRVMPTGRRTLVIVRPRLTSY